MTRLKEIAMRPTQAMLTAAHPTLEQVLCDYLDDQELETLLCVYLQNRLGYLLRPVSRQPPVDADGYVLRNALRDVALVHARRGHVAVARDARSLGAQEVDRVFVFSPTDTYGPDPAPNVTEIPRDEMVEFIRSERWSIPQSVEEWVSRALDHDAYMTG
jgi:hypothetical protein